VAALPLCASAAALDEGVSGDFSANRLAPTVFTLDQANGGSNTLSGTVGRMSGVVDLDYINVVVPSGFLWTSMLVGNQTTGGGGGAFIGLASGSTMPLLPTATTAEGLLGWHLYSADDRGTDILDDMAIPSNGSSGFERPLPAGSYTFWIQELSTGAFPYSFNLTVTPVPEPTSALLLLMGLAATATAARRTTRRS
jgi:hypothetical protein